MAEKFLQTEHKQLILCGAGEVPEVAVAASVRLERTTVLPFGGRAGSVSFFLSVKRHFLGARQTTLFGQGSHGKAFQTPHSSSQNLFATDRHRELGAYQAALRYISQGKYHGH